MDCGGRGWVGGSILVSNDWNGEGSVMVVPMRYGVVEPTETMAPEDLMGRQVRSDFVQQQDEAMNGTHGAPGRGGGGSHGGQGGREGEEGGSVTPTPITIPSHTSHPSHISKHHIMTE